MLSIRPGSIADAPVLARIHIASWRGAYRGLMPASVLDHLSEEAFTANWTQRLTQMPGATLVALVGEHVVGFTAAGPSRDADAVRLCTGELYALYVHPEHWGTGAGEQLWRTVHQQLLNEGFSEITLWVLEGNHRARRFYERMGLFLECGAVKAIERHGAVLPEVRYRMPLG